MVLFGSKIAITGTYVNRYGNISAPNGPIMTQTEL